MEASLTCAVCLSVFRDPVTLPLCSHNFCKSCVLECGGETHTRSLRFTLPGPAQVTCPLCRKVSSIPGGLAVLPINTTLAELVRFLSLGSREEGAGAQETDYSEKGVAGRCPEHPEQKLELFCKNCAVLCCGKCVSCHHQGIFHNVNLLDMVYQEEKLIFFNSLKKLREMHERFTKNTSDDKDVKDTLKKNIDVVSLAFDEAYKALDLKKKQCLEFAKQQQTAAIKRREVRETAMAHQKVTIESLLKDCESLVDESEPKCFLQMACSLNKRMTSNLDLMELTASHDQDIVNPKPPIVDLKAVLDAISAVNITACTSNVSQPKFNGISFKTITKIWNPEQTPAEKYSPVQSQELCYLQGQIQKLAIRLLSITEMPEYKHLSFEELRMKYMTTRSYRKMLGFLLR
ncbi:putative tripartite motif-containing protein 61 isoform X1 [Rana temporaria]|uniref:putative tripartite motif-containing protein 61 isoform X1 n=1 Tax=Rana temporaria TaxID=8407 RepID=UPI001AAD1094|nr:putative tripartite motif-containing protein 61 isoform X1 [Rana temporaria]